MNEQSKGKEVTAEELAEFLEGLKTQDSSIDKLKQLTEEAREVLAQTKAKVHSITEQQKKCVDELKSLAESLETAARIDEELTPFLEAAERLAAYFK